MQKLSTVDIINYFLSLTDMDSGEGISNLKLQKIMYYAQALHLALFDQELFEDKIEAWKYGPVISDMYHEFKIYKDNPLPSNALDQSLYSTEIREYLNEIYNTYSQCSGWKLRDLTHIINSPWNLVYKNKTSTLEIPNALMKRFYEVIISIGIESNNLKSLKEKIAFCYSVEETALENPDLPIDFIAGCLSNNGVRFHSLDNNE